MAQKFTASKKHWDPMVVKDGVGKYAILLLNYSLDSMKVSVFQKLWSDAQLRIAVDGGTNYLTTLNSTFILPDIISGDFDSIKPSLLEYYRKKNVKIIETPDQNETDFTKAVRILINEMKNGLSIEYVIVIWSTSGRIDHVLSNINTLYKLVNEISVPLFLYYIGESLSWILTMGEHSIESNATSTWCSLVPVGEPCTLTTTGLKWNLTDHKMFFGSLISTSNEFDFKHHKLVNIITDKPVLWSMNIS